MKCRLCGLGWEALEGGFLACSICEESGTHVKVRGFGEQKELRHCNPEESQPRHSVAKK